MPTYYVYLLASRSRTLYVGVTNDLVRRVEEHKAGPPGSFTTRYRVNRLVHFEATDDVRAAIAREKQIKRWRRAKKLDLVARSNPDWADLSERWRGSTVPSLRSG